MDKIIKLVKKVLLEEMHPMEGMKKYHQFKTALSLKELSKASCVFRMFRTLNNLQWSNRDSWLDFLVHLRQFILMFNHKVTVSERIQNNIKDLANDFGLIMDNAGEIDALNEYPFWIEKSEYLRDLFDLPKREKDEEVLGDGILYNKTGNLYYKSKGQKAAAKLWCDLEDGHTMLVCMPTGGGKSLIGQMPVFSDMTVGTTIVVVPTVALAIDQERSTKSYFMDIEDKNHLPRAYHGGLSSQEKNNILGGVKKGTIPILYISPEAILNGPFHDILLESAEKGKIDRFVIDESHIVIDWGGHFRTEFQFLSIFRKKLLKASNGAIKTLLLSATITDRTTEILKNLFSEDNNFVQIRADSLRSELMFWLDKSHNTVERQKKILETLHILPRPIIIYVISPKKTEEWKKLIIEKGFRSIETFSGETSTAKREDIVKRWENNEIDVIIANSAFGMGVDKRDVRAVIHCCIPESINRYYQEVGRGGRDGLPSLSLWSVVMDEDADESFNLFRSSILKPEKIVSRWESLVRKAKDKIKGDTYWIDMDSRPYYLENSLTGNLSAGWNEFVLLFLYRNGLIDLLDIKVDEVTFRHQVLVKIKNIEIMTNPKAFLEYITPIRDEDWIYIKGEFNKITALIEKPIEKCWGEKFIEIYPFARECCGGCPSCRANNIDSYNLENFIEIYGNEKDKNITFEKDVFLSPMLQGFIGLDRELFVYYNDISSSAIFYKIFAKLIKVGIKRLIIPSINEDEWKIWIKELPYKDVSQYNIYDINEIRDDINIFLTNGPIAVFYADNESENNNIYKWTQKYIDKNVKNKIIHIGPYQLWINNENKQLNELIDGMSINSETLLR